MSDYLSVWPPTNLEFLNEGEILQPMGIKLKWDGGIFTTGLQLKDDWEIIKRPTKETCYLIQKYESTSSSTPKK